VVKRVRWSRHRLHPLQVSVSRVPCSVTRVCVCVCVCDCVCSSLSFLVMSRVAVSMCLGCALLSEVSSPVTHMFLPVLPCRYTYDY
jgi:hypothetical protein